MRENISKEQKQTTGCESKKASKNIPHYKWAQILGICRNDVKMIPNW